MYKEYAFCNCNRGLCFFKVVGVGGNAFAFFRSVIMPVGVWVFVFMLVNKGASSTLACFFPFRVMTFLQHYGIINASVYYFLS